MHHSGIHGWRWARTTWLVLVCAIGFHPIILTVVALGFTATSASAAEPDWWTKQKRDLGLPPGLAYNTWVAQGMPRPNSGSSSGTSRSTQDQLALAAAGQVGAMIGTAIHKQLFGDPVEDARIAAEAQERALAAQRAAELAAAEAERKKQEDFNRLRGSLKLDSFDGDAGGGLVLKGMDVGSGSGLALKLGDPDDRPAPKAKAAANELGLKLGDDDLKPQGTVAVANTNPVNLTLPNTDPMVVDARNVPSGLPKSVEDAIPLTPAGDRVRKGFQAISEHDWPVALLWFKDARNLEPGDPGLQRLVDLAEFTIQRRYEPVARPVDEATAVTMEKLGNTIETGMLNQELNRSLENFNRAHPPQWLKPESEAPSDAEWRRAKEPGHEWKEFFRLFTPTHKDSPLGEAYGGTRA